MQAINHAATALILKKKFPSTPLFALILATEVVEYLWVGLNVFGIEKTIVNTPMLSVADVELAHMPFSHSIATSVLFAVAAGLLVIWKGGKAAPAIAVAITLAVFSHIMLDLLVHAPDIALAPFFDGAKYGTGLYAHAPLPTLALETLWAVLCWRIYRGSWALLGLIVVINLSSIPFYSVAITMGETALGGQSTIFALVILMQMLITSALVWIFARGGQTGTNAAKHALPVA